jgi:hypothetical protein
LLDASRFVRQGAANAGAVMHLPSEQKQVDAALKILAPAERARKRCTKDIGSALSDIWFVANDKPNIKQVKIALNDYIKALKRCQTKYRALRKAENNPVNKKVYEDFFDDFFSQEIAICEDQLKQPTRPPRRTAYKQKAAVEAARSLITKYCGKQNLAKTRGGKWHRLSKILAGDEKDPFRHML